MRYGNGLENYSAKKRFFEPESSCATTVSSLEYIFARFLPVPQEDKRLFHSRYQVGKAIALEDFDAAVKLFQARLAQLESVYKYRLAEARLVFASGSM